MKSIFIDIDETICFNTGEDSRKNKDYSLARPYLKRIEQVNSLYHSGHHIVYWTARGATTGIDWRDLTETQLEQWGCLYHELRLDKPAYDIFVDDKNINSEDFFEE